MCVQGSCVKHTLTPAKMSTAVMQDIHAVCVAPSHECATWMLSAEQRGQAESVMPQLEPGGWLFVPGHAVSSGR